MEGENNKQSPGRNSVKTVRLEKDLEHSLCLYPELIDDGLWGVRQGMEVLGPNYATLKRQDRMPNGKIADLVFVRVSSVLVVEIKKNSLKVRATEESGDVVDQIVGYIQQCRIKYPNLKRYRGIIIGTGIADSEKLMRKIVASKEDITPLIFGKHIPSVIKFCGCGRALGYNADFCRCGARCE